MDLMIPRSKIIDSLPDTPTFLTLALALMIVGVSARASSKPAESLINGPDVAAIGGQLEASGYYSEPVTTEVTPQLGDAIARYSRDTRMMDARKPPQSPQQAAQSSKEMRR